MKKETLNLIALLIIGFIMLCIPTDNPQDGQQLQPVKQDTTINKATL